MHRASRFPNVDAKRFSGDQRRGSLRPLDAKNCARRRRSIFDVSRRHGAGPTCQRYPMYATDPNAVVPGTRERAPVDGQKPAGQVCFTLNTTDPQECESAPVLLLARNAEHGNETPLSTHLRDSQNLITRLHIMLEIPLAPTEVCDLLIAHPPGIEPANKGEKHARHVDAAMGYGHQVF